MLSVNRHGVVVRWFRSLLVAAHAGYLGLIAPRLIERRHTPGIRAVAEKITPVAPVAFMIVYRLVSASQGTK